MKKTVVELAGLHKWYRNLHVLRGVALSIEEGERLVLCGRSGSGKSTLIRCINGLERHDEGRLVIDGQRMPTSDAGGGASRPSVGMVFQHFNLFPHLSVLGNLMLAPRHVLKMHPRAARELALHWLSRTGLADRAQAFPNELSGGEQQRTAIARALCMQPKILLLDEPTSALDPLATREVVDVLVELAAGGVTMLCVTHAMGFARIIAERVLFMDDGEIVESGPPEAIFHHAEHERTQAFFRAIIGT